MIAFIDYYYSLEITATASTQEIKTNYKKLAKKYHPDRNPDDNTAKSKMQSINEAYNILGNANARLLYDQERINYYNYISAIKAKTNPNAEQTTAKSQHASNIYAYSNGQLNDWILKAKKDAEKNKASINEDRIIGYLAIFGFFLSMVLIVIANLYRLGVEFGVFCIILILFTFIKCFVSLLSIFSRIFKNPTHIWLLLTLMSCSPSIFLFLKLTDTENYHKSGPIVVISLFFTFPCIVCTAIAFDRRKAR